MFLIICPATFILLLVDDESTVAVHTMVDFSIVVVIAFFSFLFSQITETPLARMTGRTKARSAESSSLRDCSSVRPGL